MPHTRWDNIGQLRFTTYSMNIISGPRLDEGVRGVGVLVVAVWS